MRINPPVSLLKLFLKILTNDPFDFAQGHSEYIESMKKIILILFTLIFFLVLISNLPLEKNSPTVTIKNKTFRLDVAKTEKERTKGLSIYDKLPLDKGMIFIFNKNDYHSFWMKDMKFPLDIIYINNNKIVDIFKTVLPTKSENETQPIITPKFPADTVLEINAGLSDKYNFKIGDFVKINL